MSRSLAGPDLRATSRAHMFPTCCALAIPRILGHQGFSPVLRTIGEAKAFQTAGQRDSVGTSFQLASCVRSARRRVDAVRVRRTACLLRAERALQLRGACGLDEPCGGISASLSVRATPCPAPLRASLAPAFSRSRANGRSGSSTLRLCRAVSGAPIRRRPPRAVSGALVDRWALSRRAAPLAPRARVFALAREWSSGKLDLTVLQCRLRRVPRPAAPLPSRPALAFCASCEGVALKARPYSLAGVPRSSSSLRPRFGRQSEYVR